MTAANLMKSNAGYINTGAWSDKAIKEAKRFGEVTEVASSKDRTTTTSQKQMKFQQVWTICTLRLTTPFLVPVPSITATDAPLIADMSSDIFSEHSIILPLIYFMPGHKKIWDQRVPHLLS